MAHIVYTIFTDQTLTEARQIADLIGDNARKALTAFRDLKGMAPREGDIIAGCRIELIDGDDPYASEFRIDRNAKTNKFWIFWAPFSYVYGTVTGPFPTYNAARDAALDSLWWATP